MKTRFTMLLLILVYTPQIFSDDFNTLSLETINHWEVKYSSVDWESATIKNALSVPFIYFLEQYLKGRYDLNISFASQKTNGYGIHVATPECSKEECSDFYIEYFTSNPNKVFGYNVLAESFESKFNNNITVSLYNEYERLQISTKQKLDNLVIGYNNDFYFFQESPYLKNLGLRFGILLDAYYYTQSSTGIDDGIILFSTIDTNNPSSNTYFGFPIQNIHNEQIDYIEAAIKAKLGINYMIEFLNRHLVAINFDYFQGWGGISYKKKDSTVNPNIFSLLSNPILNLITINTLVPRSRITDGPATLTITGNETSLSYGWKFNSDHIVKVFYRVKQEQHKISSPRIEPDETFVLTPFLSGSLDERTILSSLNLKFEILPNNLEVQKFIGISYMFRF